MKAILRLQQERSAFNVLYSETNVLLYLAHEIVKYSVMKQNVAWFWTLPSYQKDDHSQNNCVQDFQVPKYSHFTLDRRNSPNELPLPTRIIWFSQYCILWSSWKVNDFFKDATTFGNMANFVGTIDMADPFSNKPPTADGLVDKVHDGKWFQCTMLLQKESLAYILLPLIGYIDKNLNQCIKLFLIHSVHIESVMPFYKQSLEGVGFYSWPGTQASSSNHLRTKCSNQQRKNIKKLLLLSFTDIAFIFQ